MKILLINTVCGIKSTGRICTDLALAMEARGHEVKIAYGRDHVPEQYARFAVPIGTKWDTYAHCLLARLTDGAGLGSRNATENFLKWAREFDPDVIHLHNLHGYYLHLPGFFQWLKDSKKKMIWTLHDCWPFTGHSATCDEAGCDRWKTGCHHCPLRKVYPSSLVDRSAVNWRWKRQCLEGLENLTVVCPSRWLAAQTEASVLTRHPLAVIPNGIDTDVFRPMGEEAKDTLGLQGKRMILGVASSWTDSKGYGDFLVLASRLPENFRIVMVGLTEEQEKSLPGNIIGIRRTDSVRELAQLYSAADVFLNLTYCDTYPTVNLEALCCGTPVLTYRTGGSPESLREDCGDVAERGDLDQVLALLPRCMEKKRSVTDRAEEFRRMFAREKAMEAYLDLYLE